MQKEVSLSRSSFESRKGNLNEPIHSVYLDRIRAGHTSWPVSPLVDGIPDIENITMALKTGPYGQCVYESDNDVADNQVRLPFILEVTLLTRL